MPHPRPEHELDTWRWLASDAAAPILADLKGAGTDPDVVTIARLRKSISHDQLSAAIELTRARARAAKKFPIETADTIIADDAGIQMASSHAAATHKARRIERTLGKDAPVADLCCGIGGDLMALTHAGLNAHGIDADPLRTWMARMNSGAPTHTQDIAAMPLEIDADAALLDPARRDGSRRTLDPTTYEPGPGVWDSVIDRYQNVCLKLNPGVDPELFPDAEIEILSERGTLTQALVWTGSLRTCAGRATLLSKDGTTHTVTGSRDDLDDTNALRSMIATIDPSVERSGLIGALLEETRTHHVHPGLGLVTSDEILAHPMLVWFHVEHFFDYSERAAREALRSVGAGIVDVKTRDKAVDPDTLSKRLRSDQGDPRVLFVYRFGDTLKGVVTRRVTNDDPETSDDRRLTTC